MELAIDLAGFIRPFPRVPLFGWGGGLGGLGAGGLVVGRVLGRGFGLAFSLFFFLLRP